MLFLDHDICERDAQVPVHLPNASIGRKRWQRQGHSNCSASEKQRMTSTMQSTLQSHQNKKVKLNWPDCSALSVTQT